MLEKRRRGASWRRIRLGVEHSLRGRSWLDHRPLLWTGDQLIAACLLGRLWEHEEPEMFVELFEDLFESGDIGLGEF